MCGVLTKILDPFNVHTWDGGAFDPLHLFGNPTADAQKQEQAAANAAEASRQKAIQDALDQVNGIFSGAGRQAEYKKYAQDNYNLLKTSLDNNTMNENRNLRFSMSRSGNLGGSQDVYNQGLVQKDYNTGLLNASNQSQASAAALENSDQQTKSALDNMVLNGMSATDATQQAIRDTQLNTTTQQATIAPATADSLFGDIAIGYTNRQAATGASAANATGAPAPGGGLGSYFDTPAGVPQPSLDPFAAGSNPSGEA